MHVVVDPCGPKLELKRFEVVLRDASKEVNVRKELLYPFKKIAVVDSQPSSI